MADDARGIDADRFDRWRPELDHITSLDLNWGHGLNIEPRNFGRAYLYSIGNTGHRYVCACVIPGLPPEQYPIAIVDEEGYTVDVIASSISTWLPRYLVRRAGDLVHTAVYQNTSGNTVGWYAEELAAFLADEAAIRAELERFGGGVDLLDTAVELLRRPGTLTQEWRPAPPDGYAGYNKPLYREYQTSPELAYEVFHRRTHIDAVRPTAWDIVEDAAELVTAAGYRAEEPLAPLVATLAENGFGSWVWGDTFCAAGRRWLAAGNVEQALVCFENAINYYDAEDEDWHREAVLAIRSIDHDDPNYAYYVNDFLPEDFPEDDED